MPCAWNRLGRLFYRMLPTIHFDDESLLQAEKVDAIRANRHLASEAMSAKLLTA